MTEQIKHYESRTDALRPAVFDPADFEVVDYFDLDEWQGTPNFPGKADLIIAWREEQVAYFGRERVYPRDDSTNPLWQCDHCGHNPLRYIGVVAQKSTGDHYVFGSACVNRASLTDRAEFKLIQLKQLAANKRERARIAESCGHYLNENEDIRIFLDGIERGEKGEPLDQFEFVNSMDLTLNRYGYLTENQAAALRRVIVKRAEPVKEEKPKGPAPEGRVQVKGEVVSFKIHEGFYGMTEKIVIRLENGSGVWLTSPKSLHDDFFKYKKDEWVEFGDWLKGQTVELTATFTLADDDPTFAFGKRPTGAKIIREEAEVE